MSDSLSFADIYKHDRDILEVCPHDEIEISADNMDELQSMINANPGAMLLMINRCHEYSYSFGALQHIRALKNIKALALLFSNLSESYIAQVIRGNKDRSDYPIETFLDKEDAIKWLSSHR